MDINLKNSYSFNGAPNTPEPLQGSEALPTTNPRRSTRKTWASSIKESNKKIPSGKWSSNDSQDSNFKANWQEFRPTEPPINLDTTIAMSSTLREPDSGTLALNVTFDKENSEPKNLTFDASDDLIFIEKNSGTIYISDSTVSPSRISDSETSFKCTEAYLRPSTSSARFSRPFLSMTSILSPESKRTPALPKSFVKKTPGVSFTKTPLSQNKSATKRNLRTPLIIPKKKSPIRSTIKKSSRVKVPNFTAIHERALEKVESISEYKKRKEARAQMLLSGSKPTVGKKTPATKSRKELRFAANTSERIKSPTFIPLPSTPMPKKRCIESPQRNVTARNTTPRRTPKPITTPNANEKKPEVSTPVPKITMRKRLEPTFPLTMPQQHAFSWNTESKTQCVRPLHKENAKRMITTKAKVPDDSKSKKRLEIKGVRSNRRFDLLMQMRKGT